MKIFRLSRSKYARDLSGYGAEKVGGRWNSKGLPVIYSSGSIALCTAEIAVHIPLGIIPLDYKLITLSIPGKLIYKPRVFPEYWDSIPFNISSQKFGDKFIKAQKYLAMRVPSGVVRGEYNYLINPNHPQIKKVKIVELEIYSFDKRLFK